MWRRNIDYKLRWSNESIRNLENIIEDIGRKWSEKEVETIKSNLTHQLELIVQNPFLIPSSNYKLGMRKAVLSKQTTIFYEVLNEVIYLAYIHWIKPICKDRSGLYDIYFHYSRPHLILRTVFTDQSVALLSCVLAER